MTININSLVIRSKFRNLVISIIAKYMGKWSLTCWWNISYHSHFGKEFYNILNFKCTFPIIKDLNKEK
jgi:hypothetical protein